MEKTRLDSQVAHSGWWSSHHDDDVGKAAESYPRWAVVARWIESIAKACTFIAAGILLAGFSDRTPPFRLISSTVPQGVPGATITFDAQVWRDIGHECSVTMYRYVFHSGGRRVDHEPQVFGYEVLRAMEYTTPGRMAPQIVIPIDAEPGKPARMDSTLRYTCNKYQKIFPVDVHTSLPFVVLPP